MARDLLLGQLDPDLACAIALNFVEHDQVVITLEALTLNDPHQRTSRTQAGWLSNTDPLDQFTREYLSARREAMQSTSRASQSGWAGASAVKSREAANARAIQARSKAAQLLQARGVFRQARSLGLRVHEAN